MIPRSFQQLLATLLHYANSDPPWNRQPFYDLKERLLRRYGRFAGHEIQEIRKECWGPWGDEYSERTGCKGDKCPRCGGTGVFDLRWVRLERWEWCGYTFHRPAGDTRHPPDPTTVRIIGRIRHRDYGRLSNEALLWLYLLCGEWSLLWQSLTSSSYACRGFWPMCNLQWALMNLSMLLRRKQCWCGKWYWTWGSGWQICQRCRNQTSQAEEIPF